MSINPITNWSVLENNLAQYLCILTNISVSCFVSSITSNFTFIYFTLI
nr:MAG TPA: hypothetical protein [Caudoviricetes sp.]DAZ78801.1 MAG TPA: hypothetical protein [Caudoviricetes sp.]